MERQSSLNACVFCTFTCDVLRLISGGNYTGASQVPSFGKIVQIPDAVFVTRCSIIYTFQKYDVYAK